MCLGDTEKRIAYRAGLRRTGPGERSSRADIVLVFGDIGQMREIAEGSHHFDRPLARQTVERRFHLAARAIVAVTPEGDRDLPDTLDCSESRVTLLLSHRLAED